MLFGTCGRDSDGERSLEYEILPGKGPGTDEEIKVLVATTLVQTFCSAAMLIAPTLAPQLAASLGVSAALIGFQMSFLYCVAMVVSSQAGTWVRRHGACRISQYAMALVAAGCLLIAQASPLALISGTVALGISYGLTNPAAAHLLTRFTAVRRRNMVFSIKQTGVPLGGALAGVTAPPIAQSLGWQATFVSLALVAAVTTLLLQGTRARWDNDRQPHSRASGFTSLHVLRESRPTLWLGLTGGCLAAGQLSLLTYLVVFMVEDLHIGLVVAGLIMSAVHVSGVCGRIVWGVVADRLGASLTVLSALALAMIALFLLTTSIDADWPRWLVVTIFIAAGSTAVGWNGVYLAAVAQRTPDRVSEATGAVLVLTYLGVLVGPSAFALTVTATGSYAAGFMLPAGFATLALVFLALCRRATRHHERSASRRA